MKIGILSLSVAMGSGQSRFAINLSRGLVAMRNEVTIFAYSCDFENIEKLRRSNIDVFSYKNKLSTFDLYRSISDSKKIFSVMLRMINNASLCDYYLVLSDELVGISDYKRDKKWIYLSNGDLTLLFMNQAFLDRYYPYSHFLKKRFVAQLMNHQNSSLNYDYLFANSKFTKAIMSFFLNVNFTDYVYPPVDTEFFRPSIKTGEADETGYALVMLRNNAEPMAGAIQRIAKAVPVKIVGDAEVNGAVTLGRISDNDLVDVYFNATVTIGPSKQEFFGYSTAESLACGTPVIAFNHGGAVEMIDNNQNGWLVETHEELLSRLVEIFKHGYDKSMREKARQSSDKFSIPMSSKKLISLLQDYSSLV